MRAGALCLVPVSVAAVDDASSMLTVGSQSSMANTLLAAVGSRNVTSMQALVQELAEESLSGVGQFDEGVQAAIKKIKDVFVKSIQDALVEQHKADQEHFNCFTQDCFGGCMDTYKADVKRCEDLDEYPCDGTLPGNFSVDHATCRSNVFAKYNTMAEKCGELHCFEIPPISCPKPSCKCGDISNCHRKGLGDDGTCESTATDDDCNDVEYGSWLESTIAHYNGTHSRWESLRTACALAYKDFLETDTACDSVQESFETCLCERNDCENKACGVTYDQCEAGCWADYAALVESKECLEKDRKIDWSSTKKIECYIDVLLHEYTKEELIEKCGDANCINKAREEEYKACEAVCPNIDYDGFWPQVDASTLASPEVGIFGHAKRSKENSFLLGDGEYACDANGHDNVFTKHRGGAHREEEARCTEHLDLDYQTPQCMACKDPPPPVCDAAFHWQWYRDFDDAAIMDIGCANNDCNFASQQLATSANGDDLQTITIKQHSKAWAYNRCQCKECDDPLPVYPGRPDGRQCGMGAHTLSPSSKKDGTMEFHQLCLDARGDKPASLEIPGDFCAARVVLTHRSGRVGCAGKSASSNWGCGSSSVAVVLAEGYNNRVVTAPVFNTAVGMTPHYHHKHAHWYAMDGVTEASEQMTWTFVQPYQFSTGSYKLWYNEDMTGGTEGDNAGSACYDVAFEPSPSCNEIAPLQFSNICVGAAGDAPGTIQVPAGTCVSEITMHHIGGHLNCRGATTGQSFFGCDGANGGLNMVVAPHGERSVLFPKAHGPGVVKGYTKFGHGRPDHWYSNEGMTDADGLLRNKETLKLELQDAMKVSGALDIWYGEDLTGWTEGDNSGQACYEVAVHRAVSC